MKLIVFAVLLCLSVCCLDAKNPKVTTWGQVSSRTLGSKNVLVSSSMMQVKKYVLSFPDTPFSPYTIFGITHLDYKSHPVNVRFIKGGVGQKNVTLQIESQRGHGINSTFIFYTM